jgi:DNA-binding beta-propeller fold protein YncE
LGDFPVNIAVHPAGQYAAVLHSGYAKHEILLVDLNKSEMVTRVPVAESFYGLEFSRDGRHLFCSGAGDEVIHVFSFADGKLAAGKDIRVRPARERGVPCGLDVSRDGRTLYVANVWGQCVSLVDLDGSKEIVSIPLFVSGTNEVKTGEGFKKGAEVDPDLAAITKRAEVANDPTSPDAPFPYACRLDEKRQRLYVSLWAQACVAVIDLKTRQVVAKWSTEEHPNEMVLTKSGSRLFVANANRNTVTVLDPATGKIIETLDASLAPNSPPGSTPNSLAVAPDEKKLFVANACNNNLAVFDISQPGQSRALGFIPVGWYPTSVRVTPDGRKLLVANGKGLSSRANPKGPQPGKRETVGTETIKDLFPGAMSIIDLPREKEFTAQLAAYTAQAYLCVPTPHRPSAQSGAGGGIAVSASPASTNGPVPFDTSWTSPIKYCIYIIKENRTYDQILGDLPQGNGDASLCLFPEKVTPNHHKLAREFVLLDNFYVDAEVSADGHEWSMAAYATDFVEKEWPMDYGHNRSKKFPYPSEGGFPIAAPASGYLWDRAREAGVSYRSYGEFVHADKKASNPNTTRIAALQGHFDPWYHVFDTGYPDVKRAERFIAELKRFESEGEMPRLQIVRLPNDHTAGAVLGSLTPTALVADNDLGLGMVVEAVSHSRFWSQTAIFVLEDDAQNGPDHVDAHRSPAFVISPYTRRAAVDSTMYSTSSLLRTMELILGLKPMTQFDAAATPMFNAFQPAPDLRPYDSAPANVDLKSRNGPLAWGAATSKKMDFSREDATDEQALNEIIWHSVRGASQAMPAPVHAAFILPHPPSKDND